MRRRVEGGAETGEHAPDRVTGVGEDPAYVGSTRAVQPEQARQVEVVAVRRTQQLEQAPRRDLGLEAAATPAPADVTVLTCEHVPDLARDAGRAAVQAPAEHEAGADAAGELHVDQVRDTATRAVLVLGHRAEVGVVVDHHRYADPLGELAGGRQLLPPGEHDWSTRADRRSIGPGTHSPTVSRSPSGMPAFPPRCARARRRGPGSRCRGDPRRSTARSRPGWWRSGPRRRRARAGDRCRRRPRHRGGSPGRPAGVAARSRPCTACRGPRSPSPPRCRAARRPGWRRWSGTDPIRGRGPPGSADRRSPGGP